MKENKKKIFLKVWGCQMNEYDSELVISILERAGFVMTEDMLKADVILLNTCSVRENAVRKVRGMIHKIRHDRGDKPALYGILGCIATHLKEDLLDDKHLKIDIIAGPDSYKRLPEMIRDAAQKHDQAFDVELSESETYSDISPKRASGVNAWLAIMRGCNNFCSYCVVPHTRGRERSRSPKSILAEVRELVADGFPQVTLLGQNVNSYHYQDIDFPALLEDVAGVKGLKRVWFTSPHPKDVADRLIDLIAAHPRICKHIHLPLQSGNTGILKKMNRPYTKTQYLRLVRKIREKCPGIAITTDMIVGFPTETEEQFQDTVDVYRKVKHDAAFIFKYSPRKGTTAARRFADDVPETEKTRRIVLLNELQKEISLSRNQELVGHAETVLIESIGDHRREGRTIQNKRVVWGNMGSGKPGDIIDIHITAATPHLLKGMRA